MTPQEYGNRYLKMSYTYNGDRYNAPIDRYLAMSAKICSPSKLLASSVAKTFLHEGIKEAEKKGTISRQHHGTLKVTAPDGQVRTIEQNSLRHAFYGKGRPSDYENVLWLATHVGQVTNDSSKVNESCSLPKDYAHDYLGTDCSGFAMNYLGVDRLIKDLDVSAPAQRRQALTDIKCGDAQVSLSPSKGYHHIAIVTTVDLSGKTAVVNTVESYGWNLIGITNRKRTIQLKSPSVFFSLDNGKPDPRNEYFYHPVPYRGAPRL